MKPMRLLPVLVTAISALFVLKSFALLTATEPTINPITPARAQDGAGKDAAGKNDPAAPDGESAASEPAQAPPVAKDPEEGSFGRSISLEGEPTAEDKLLQRLGERRDALARRAAELDLREQLLNATELRLERSVNELKGLEERIKTAEKAKEKKENEQLAGLVKMYETMKPKDAARVFNRLSLDILVDVVRQMKPRKMSSILAKMSAEAAERLTVALATDRIEQEAAPLPAALPKIEGTPTN